MVIISRNSAEPQRPGRVYVTGPHFDRDVYSSTTDREEASRFTEEEARDLLAKGKWSWLDPIIEEV